MDLSTPDFKRFKRSILSGPRFQFMIVGISDDKMREDCIGLIDAVLQAEGSMEKDKIARIAVTAIRHANVVTLTNEIHELNRAGAEVMHLVPEAGWDGSPKALPLHSTFTAKPSRDPQHAGLFSG